jgi:hypothetical protein
MRPFAWIALLPALAIGAPLSAQAVLPEALVISPEPGERVAANEVFVAVSFIDPASTLDPASVTLRVNGMDVTAQAELRGGVLTWRPSQQLATGPQRAVVSARDRSGSALAPATWVFNVSEAVAVAAAPAAPATGPATTSLGGWSSIHGSLVLEGAGQSVTGLGAPLARNEEFLPRMWLSAGGLIRPGWRYALRLHLSGYESSEQQPVNRYRFDFRAPFMSLSAGDVNPVFQGLILSGRRVRGAQGELLAGPFRIAAVGGSTRRAIGGLLMPGDPTSVQRQGTYGQNLFAVRPAVGSGELYQVGVTVMRVRDDAASIPLLRTAPSGTGVSESANPAPKDNLVAGLDLTLRLASGRVLLQYENASSLLANDISGGPLTEAGLDSIMDALGEERLGIDPSRFESFFTLNASLIPLDPTGGTNVAHQARAALRLERHLVTTEWRSIGAAYYTLGYPSLQRDLSGVRVSDAFTALDDALAVTVGFERDHDNLDDSKLATTTTSAGFLSANWQASPTGVMVSGSLRLGSRASDAAAGQDGAMDERNRAISAGVSIPVDLLSGLETRVSLNGSLIDRDDPLNPLHGSRDLYYLAGLHGETRERESTMALLLGLNQSELTGFTNETTDLFRVVGTGRHRVAPEWTVLLDGSYTGASSHESAQNGPHYTRVEALGGVELEWRATTTLALTGGVIDYADERFPTRDSRELVARLRVSRNF